MARIPCRGLLSRGMARLLCKGLISKGVARIFRRGLARIHRVKIELPALRKGVNTPKRHE